MKIADYGKAITSYIESPTESQKQKSKLKVELLDRTFLSEGTSPKENPFTLDQFKEKANIYMGAYAAKAMPIDDIRSILDDYTKQGIADGTFTADEAIKIVKDLKLSYENLGRQQQLRKDFADGTPKLKLYPRASGMQSEQEVGSGVKVSERDLNYGVTGLLEGDKFFGGAELDKGKVKIDVVNPEGDTLFKDTVGKEDVINFILGIGDPKGEKFQIKTDKDFENIELVLKKSFSEGGRAEFQDGTPSKSAFRKPYAPEIEKRIIQLHQVDKLGAQAIADKLTAEFGIKFSRAPIGKRITALKAQGLIKEVPYAERAAAINQRGEFFGKPRAEQYQVIREVRDIDRTTRFKDTGKLKYNIPKDAKFKIDFKTTDALITEIPKDLQGIQYYKTKAEAQKALDRRKTLGLTKPADPNAPQTKAYVKRQKFLKRNAPFNFNAFGDFEFHHIMNIGGPIALDTSDVAIISKKMNRRLAPYNKKLNNIGENILNLIETKPEDYLKKIKAENKKGRAIITEVKSKLPKEYRKLIGFNEVVPTFDTNKNVTGFKGKKFGGSEIKDGRVLADLSKNEIKGLKKQMISDLNKFQSAGLQDKILSGTGKVLKGVGKVIKPIGYAFGTKALFDAQALAKEQGIELSLLDKVLAVDSGDPNVAINNYMRRTDPEFAAQERAKDLAQMTDDFEEVGQTTFGKYNDQIKNIKLP